MPGLAVTLRGERLPLTPRLLDELRRHIPTADRKRVKQILDDLRVQLVEPVVGKRRSPHAAIFVYEKLPVLSAARQEILAILMRLMGDDVEAMLAKEITERVSLSSERWAKGLRGKERVLFEQAMRQHFIAARLLVALGPRVRVPDDEPADMLNQLVAPLHMAADIFEAFLIPLAYSFDGDSKPLRPAVRAILIEQLENASLDVYNAAVALSETFPADDAIERASLDRHLRKSRDSVAAGRVRDANELVAELRARR